MASTAAGAALTEEHRVLQFELRVALLDTFYNFWPLWTGSDTTFAQLISLLIPVIQAQAARSAAVSRSYYVVYRRAENVTEGSPPPFTLPPQPEAEKLVKSLYVTGEAQTRKSLAAGMPPEQAREAAIVRMSGAASRHALDGGRTALLDAIEEDTAAVGWTRVTDANPCAFCVMLASRGPSYLSAETAGFQAHDHCACFPEPTFKTGPEGWSNQALDHRATWEEAQELARERGESTGLNALRRFLDGNVTPAELLQYGDDVPQHLRDEAETAMRWLRERYPDAPLPKRLEVVDEHPLSGEAIPEKQAFVFPTAEAHEGIEHLADTIYYNREHTGTLDEWVREFRELNEGRLPQATQLPNSHTYTVIHEAAHVMHGQALMDAYSGASGKALHAIVYNAVPSQNLQEPVDKLLRLHNERLPDVISPVNGQPMPRWKDTLAAPTRYATTSPWEYVAEGVADVYKNGDGALETSKQIDRIFREAYGGRP